jgi:putative phosphoribosyl transferase
MIHDRTHAGKILAEKLALVISGKNCLLLAIPRGGVIVGDEIARRLNLPLDIIISKKITPPDYPEYAIGAITYDGVIHYGPEWERYVNDPRFEAEIKKKKTEVARQIEAYRGNTNYNFDDKTVILVDDGIATGATVCAILQWLLQKQVKEIILATPVIPFITQEIIKQFGIQIIALETPKDFSSVGQFYRKFDQIPDQIIISILEKYK